MRETGIAYTYIVSPPHPEETYRQCRCSDHGKKQSRFAVYSFARTIVSIFLELSHGSAVCHWNEKRGKSYTNEQTNEADVG